MPGRQSFAIVADVLTVVLYAAAGHFFMERLQQKSIGNALLVGLVYVAFCASVYVIMRVPSADGEPSAARTPGGYVFVSAWCFSVLVTAMIGGAGGIGQWLDRISDGGASLSGWLIMAAALCGLALVALYPAALYLGMQDGPLPSPRWAPALEFAALLGVNLMIVLTAVQWEVFFAGSEPYTDLTWRAKVLIFLLIWVVFLLFVAAPRIVFLVRSPGWPAVVTFLLGTAYFVWRSLARSAWTG